MKSTAINSSYDIIIIGSGIAGLTAGAFLAKKGKKVLILEQHDRVGGYAQSFTRHNIVFNSSVHFTGGWESMDNPRKGVLHNTLDLLGVSDKCRFAPLDPFVKVITPQSSFDIPSGIKPFIETLIRLSPSEEKKIRWMAKLAITISDQIRKLPYKMNLFDYILMPLRFPHICLYGNKTLQTILDSTFSNNTIKLAFGLLSFCFGTPISRVSFIFWTHLFQSFIEERAGYCIGTFQNLANTLAEAVINNSGSIALNTTAHKIVVENNKVVGVIIDNNRMVHSGKVISNADLVSTYSKLLDTHKQTEPFLTRIRQMRPSASAFSVFLQTDFDVNELNAGHISLILSSEDLIALTDYHKSDAAAILMSIPSISDKSAQYKGKHGITLVSLYPYTHKLTITERESLADSMIQRMCDIYPQLNGHIISKESSTPHTYERYTLNQAGAMIGWEYAPDQVGFKRPSIESPIEGLYHTGHWTRPGGGMYGAIISGRLVAQKVLGYKDQKSFVRSFTKN
jgi:prolycopene isomerase